MSSVSEKKKKEFRGIPLQLEITTNADLSTYESSPLPLRDADLNSYNLNAPLRTNDEPLASPVKVFFEKNPSSSLPDVSFKKVANKVRFDEDSIQNLKGFKETRSFGLENIMAELCDPEFEKELEDFNNDVDNTFLEMGTLRSDVVLNQLREATAAIRRRDQIIDQLVKDKEEYKNETKKYEIQVQKLEETIDKLQENFEKSYGPNGSAFELSSYLNPPKANSTLISEIPHSLDQSEIETHERTCQTEELHYVNNGTQMDKTLETVDQTTQSNEEISRENQMIQVELKVESKEEHSQTKSSKKKDSSISTEKSVLDSKSCQTLIQDLDSSVLKDIEIGILKEFSKKALPQFLSLNPMREFTVQNLADFLCAIQEKQAEAFSIAKMEHSVDLDKLNEDRINLNNEIDYLKETNSHQFEEIRSLKTKIAQLEDSKISYERKLTSLSARLSPEGSELDVQSVSLAAEEMNSDPQLLNENPSRKDDLVQTPGVECIGDGEILERSGGGSVEPQITSSSSVIDDLKLQLLDLEKKYEWNKKYLEEQTTEREIERDEFHKELEALQLRVNSERREKEKLEDLLLQQKSDFDDNENRLKEAYNYEQELIANSEKLDEELKSAVEKIEELRDIIKEHEVQIDSAAQDVQLLQEQNIYFRKELDKKAELLKEKEDLMNSTQETIQTVTSDLTEELHAQIEDLSKKFEKKLVEMDNFHWTNRPDSGCSGGISNSTEDVSVRELTIINREKKEWSPVEASSIISKGLQNLDSHFESLVRFEEVIIKKLKDTEMRFTVATKKLQDLENQRNVYLKKYQEQIGVISDLEGRIDQFRFEPSPNAVTLRGLKARVITLSQELEEYKGKLELKDIELQDLGNKNAANIAQLLNYTKARENPVTSSVRKSSACVQTEVIEKRGNWTQTRMKLEAATRETGMQTVHQLHNSPQFDSLDLSTIQGVPPPKHSTPNDYESVKKFRSKKLESRSLISTLTLDENPKSPEILRTDLTRNASIQSEPKCRKFKTVSFEEPRECQFTKGFENEEIEKTMSEKQNVSNETMKNASSKFTSVEKAESEGAGYKPELTSQTASSAVTVQPKSGEIPTSTPLVRKSSSSRYAQTPPIAVEGLVAALSDDEKKSLLSNLGASYPPDCSELEREKNVEIAKLRERIEELEILLKREKDAIENGTWFSQLNILPQIGQVGENPLLREHSNYKKEERLESPSRQINQERGIKLPAQSTHYGIRDVGGKSLTRDDWNRLEREQNDRMAATDKMVEAEALKTQIHQITNEISKYQLLHEDQIQKLQFDKEKCMEMVRLNTAQRSLEAKKRDKSVDELEKALDFEIQLGQQLRLEMCEQHRVINSQKYEIELLMEEKRNLNQKLQVCDAMSQEYAQLALPSGDSRKADRRFLELYLRTKSYRKALGWQKRYLSVVILGYKDLLCATGVTYDHPQILQREIPLSPGAVGICDLKKPKTRFKIAVCAAMAVFRMKYMVRRWAGRAKSGAMMLNWSHNSQPPRTTKAPMIESESSSDSNTNPIVLSPPTRESKTRPTRLKGKPEDSNAKYSNPEDHETKEVFPNKDEEQNLLEYLERFNRLEKEIGQTIRLSHNRNTLTQQQPNNR